MPRFFAIAAAALIVATSFLVSPNFRDGTPGERMPYAGDFLHEYVGGHIVRTGEARRLYDRDYYVALEHDPALVGFRLRADRLIPMVYPPAYYLLVSPLSALPYRTAAWVWAAVSLAAFGLAVWGIGRALGEGGDLDRAVPATDPRWRRVRGVAAMLALPAAVAFAPFAENLVSSQKATFVLLALTGAFLALRAGHRTAAGLILGLLALKPQIAVVVPAVLVAKREWRVGAGVVASVGLLVAISLAMGAQLTWEWVRFATAAADYIRFGAGYRHRLHGLYGFWTLLAGEPTALVRAATLASSIGVVALVARLVRGPLDLRSPRFPVQFSGLVLTTLLVSPHVLTYDLTVLLLPMSLLGWLVLRGAMGGGRRRAILWLVVALYAACGLSPLLAERTGFQLTTPLMVALLAVLSPGPAPGGPSASGAVAGNGPTPR